MATVRLQAFRSNLPSGKISENYIAEYHNILNSLEEITGENLSDFLIADERLSYRVKNSRPEVRSGNRVTQQGHVTYTKLRYCDREWLFMKLEGVISYMELLRT